MGNCTEGPKLFVNKPKKGQLKKVEHLQQPLSSMASSDPPPGSAAAAAAAAPLPQPPKESFLRRYKFVVPLLLAVNLSAGAYLFMRTKKKDIVEEKEVPGVPPAPASTSIANATITEKPAPDVALNQAVVTPLELREPIPQNEQRELFKWLLEEKRKLKPTDSTEKKRIDEEKAILKEFIRAKSIPIL